MARERILVALSGGVDSSVAALLLKREGHDVEAAYMKNWINEDNVIGHCPWMQDIEDARAAAERIGVPFRVVNLMSDYRRLVVDYLLDGYRRGLTPNPDVMCNREMKFGVFAKYARAEGFSALATGHYARRVVGASLADARAGPPLWAGRPHPAVERADLSALSPPNALGSTRSTSSAPRSPLYRAVAGVGDPGPGSASPATTGGARPPDALGRAGPLGPPLFDNDAAVRGGPSGPALPRHALLEGSDSNKDQSYFLALLSPEQLEFARFPIGRLKKPELRAIARDAGLPNADKKDSQGICFIGEVKMADFLKAYMPEHPGPIVRATDGKVLGGHRGLHYYTIGQRRGIRIPSNTDNQAYVVTGKRAEDHALLVAFDGPDAPGLWTDTAHVHSLSWLAEPIVEPRRLECRVRYRDPRVPIEFIPQVERVDPNALFSASLADAPAEVGRVIPNAPSSPSLAAPKLGVGGSPSSDLRPPTSALVRFDSPQRALAPGQILALYDGERLLGGGVFV